MLVGMKILIDAKNSVANGGYEQRSYSLGNDTFCSKYLGVVYSKKGDAESICDQMQLQYHNCTTIYDVDCDADNYRICREESVIKPSSQGSCTHSAIGKVFAGCTCKDYINKNGYD